MTHAPRHPLAATLLTALLFALLGGCGGKKKESQPSSDQTPKQTQAETTPSVSAPPSKELLDPEAADAKAPADFKVQFKTTKGDVVLEIHRDWAPNGADRFYNLVRIGFFTDVAFFRVIQQPRPFMVQFGISGNPTVSAVWREATISDDPVKHSNARGTLTFATSGPDSRTTQLFINFANNSFLDKQGFSPIGEVVKGMDVVDSLYSEYGDAPSQHQRDIQLGGNEYLHKNYPKLDYLKSAEILPSK